MDRRRFLQLSGATVGAALGTVHPAWSSQTLPESSLPRGLAVYVDERLEDGNSYVQQIRSSLGTSPLLKALSSGLPIMQLDMAKPEAELSSSLAFNHLLLIAKSDDPLLQKVWQREAVISRNSIYAFGFGNLQGSLGYIESDRNPFLHAANIAKAPFECEIISITGTDTPGISLAVAAFLEQGLVNGIIAKNGEWKRGSTTLLDRDPLAPSFRLPSVIPTTLGSLHKIALTQAAEDEYRGVLSDTGSLPLSIWRAKYFESGQWDGAGEFASFHNYAVGLHRRAYGNTVWAATFANTAAALAAAPLIAKAAKLPPQSSRWQGTLPQYAWGLPVMGDAPHTGTLELWVDGVSVLMASQTVKV
jgi:hypothetical protein